MDQQEAVATAADDDKADRKGRHAKILEQAREDFAAAVESEAEDRAEALDDIRFARLGEQWPAEVAQARDKAKRPRLTINRMPSFLRQVVNDGRQNRPSIKVRPVDSGSDPLTAQVMSGLIRNIEYTSNADVAYDTALECAAGNGFGYWRVNLIYASDDTFELDLAVERIANPFTVYRDWRSTAADSSDWNRAFITELVKRDDFERIYKDADKSDWQAEYDQLSAPWREENDIRLAEYWQRTETVGKLLQLSSGLVISEENYLKQKQLFDKAGLTVSGDRETRTHKVMQYILSGAEVLSERAWPGKYIPIVPVYGDEVNVEGKRVFRSMIRDAKDPQRMFNYWRTTATELVALAPKAPWVGPKGFTKSDPKWKTANAENHSTLEYDLPAGQQPPTRQAFDPIPAGALQEAANASDDMKAVLGLYDASLGARSNETSGVAINARQREGDVANFHFADNQSRGIRHTGRILIDLIPKVYTGPRVVRVLGADGTPNTVPINQQVQRPDGTPGIYDLTAGKYDLTVEAGPSYTTKRQEAASQMVELIRAYPAITPMIGDLLAKNLDWPGSDEIAERLRAMLPPQLQGKNPQVASMQQQMQQMDQQAKAAVAQLQQELQKTQQQLAEAKTKSATAELDKRVDLLNARISFYGEVTKRMQAGLELVEGAENDPEMLGLIGEAQAVVGGLQAQRDAAVQQREAQRQGEQQQALAAVAAISAAIERIAAPRDVQRGPDGLIVRH